MFLTFYPYLNILTLPTGNKARHSADRQSAKLNPGGNPPGAGFRSPERREALYGGRGPVGRRERSSGWRLTPAK